MSFGWNTTLVENVMSLESAVQTVHMNNGAYETEMYIDEVYILFCTPQCVKSLQKQIVPVTTNKKYA